MKKKKFSILFLVVINDEFPKIIKEGEGDDKVPHKDIFATIAYLKSKNISNIQYINFPLIFTQKDKSSGFFKKKVYAKKKGAGFYTAMLKMLKEQDYYIFYIPLWNESLNSSIRIAQEIKKKYPSSKNIFFGPCCNLFPDQIICEKSIDFVITSEPEEAIEGIIIQKSLQDVPNICYQGKKGAVVNTEKGLDLKGVDYYIDYSIYFDFIKKYSVTAPPFIFFEISRGCIYDCFFCSLLTYKKLRYKGINFAFDELMEVVKKTKVNNIFFTDNELNFSNNYLEKFLDLIIERGLDIKWTSYMVAKGVSKNLLTKMKKAGCLFVRWGIESVNIKRQKMISKNLLPSEVAQIIKDSHETGLINQVSFTIGYPYDCDIDKLLTIQFIESNHQYIDSVNLNKFKPRRKSNIYNNPNKYDITIINASIEKDEVPFFENQGLDWSLKKAQQNLYFNEITEALSQHGIKNADPEVFFKNMLMENDTYH